MLHREIQCETPVSCIGIASAIEALGYQAEIVGNRVKTDAPREVVQEALMLVEDSLDLEESSDD